MTKIDFLENSELILQQWKDSSNLKGLIDAYMTRGNDIQDALFEVQDFMSIDTAEGEGLDFIGKVFSVERASLDDTAYRSKIKQRASARYSGEPESVISVTKSLFGGTFSQYSPEYPGKYRIRTDAEITNDELQVFSPAGVQGFLAGYIVDAYGNHIVSATGDHLVHTTPGQRQIITDGDGLAITDGDGNSLETVGHYE